MNTFQSKVPAFIGSFGCLSLRVPSGVASPKLFWGKNFDFKKKEQQYFVSDTASQSTKSQETLELWGKDTLGPPGYIYGCRLTEAERPGCLIEPLQGDFLNPVTSMAIMEEVVGDVIAPAVSVKEISHFHLHEVTFKCHFLWCCLSPCFGHSCLHVAVALGVTATSLPSSKFLDCPPSSLLNFCLPIHIESNQVRCMGGGTFFKVGAQVHVKKHIKMFVVWIGNYDVTWIEIWRHYLYTIWRSKLLQFRQNETTMKMYRWTTWNSNRMLQMGDPG